jgi:CcmD family protein
VDTASDGGIGYVLVAYGVIWLGFFGYLAWIGIKTGKLEKEIENLKK